MKTAVLFYILICFGMFNINSQTTTTYQINWAFGVNGAVASKVIEVGDTVEWVWGDNLTHNVATKPGSTETFKSELESGLGFKYTHTFNSIGTNNYECEPHSRNMYGTITVVAEGELNTKDFSINQFSISPNPGNDRIHLKFPSSIQDASVKVFDILGKQVYSNNNDIHKPINVFSWSKGVYLIIVSSQEKTKTKKFIKH